MTVEEFLEWDPGDRSGARWQLRDGEPEMMAPASERHARLLGELNYLFAAHFRAQNSPCSVAVNPGVIPHVHSRENYRVPDLAITCVPEPSTSSMPEPVVVFEILSPSNEAETRSNIWTYTTIPSVQEIVVLRSTAICAEILRRGADGNWPQQSEIVEANGDLSIPSIGFMAP